MERFVLLLLIILCNGCAKTVYVKPNLTQTEFNKDFYECKMQATNYAAQWSGSPGTPNVFMLPGAIRECMTMQKGYSIQDQN